MAGLIVLDVALYPGSKFISPVTVGEPPVPASVEGSPYPAQDCSYQTMEGSSGP